MSRRSFIKTVIMSAALVCLPVLLCACGRKINVTVIDHLLSVEAEAHKGDTVAGILMDADLSVGENDVVEPSMDTVMTEDGGIIRILRHVSVKVTADDIQETVELTGGTVSDALNAAGVELSGNEYTNITLDCPLVDGMDIRVIIPEAEPEEGSWKLKSVLSYIYMKDGKVVKNSVADGLALDADGVPSGNIAARSWAYTEAVYNEVAEPGMSGEEILRAAFDFIGDKANLPYKMKVPFYTEENWPYVYMDDMLSTGKSDCHALAAFFGRMAKLCGYEKVYLCSNGKHAWTEIDGLIYDPVFNDWNEDIYGFTYKEASEKKYLASYIDYSEEDSWRYQRVPERDEELEYTGGMSDDELLKGAAEIPDESQRNGWYVTDQLSFRFGYFDNGKLVSEQEIDGVRLDENGTPVYEDDDYVFAYIQALYNTLTTPDMSQEEKLERGFFFIGDKSNFPYKQISPSYDAEDWPVYYMNDMLVNGESDCHALAAFFGYYAVLCGYDDVVLCATGPAGGTYGSTRIDGLIYDPVVIDWPQLVYANTLEETLERADILPGYGNFEEGGDWRYIRIH